MLSADLSAFAHPSPGPARYRQRHVRVLADWLPALLAETRPDCAQGGRVS